MSNPVSKKRKIKRRNIPLDEAREMLFIDCDSDSPNEEEIAEEFVEIEREREIVMELDEAEVVDDPAIETTRETEPIASTSGVAITAGAFYSAHNIISESDESDIEIPQISDSDFIARSVRTRRRPSRRRSRGRVRSVGGRAQATQSRSTEGDGDDIYVCIRYILIYSIYLLLFYTLCTFTFMMQFL